MSCSTIRTGSVGSDVLDKVRHPPRAPRRPRPRRAARRAAAPAAWRPRRDCPRIDQPLPANRRASPPSMVSMPSRPKKLHEFRGFPSGCFEKSSMSRQMLKTAFGFAACSERAEVLVDRTGPGTGLVIWNEARQPLVADRLRRARPWISRPCSRILPPSVGKQAGDEVEQRGLAGAVSGRSSAWISPAATVRLAP